MHKIYVFILKAQFTTDELVTMRQTLRTAFGQVVSFVFSEHKFNPPNDCTRSVVVFKLSPYRIRSLYPEQNHIHDMSFTTIYTKPTFVVFNKKNWDTPPAEFTLSKTDYHIYVTNHEFGHAFGIHTHQHRTDSYCPLMYQQTRGTIGCGRIDLYPTSAQLRFIRAFLDRKLIIDQSD